MTEDSANPPLQIVHLTTYVHPDKFGGAERVVHGVATAQASLGHRVTVLSGNHDARRERESHSGFELVRYALKPGMRGATFFREVHASAARALECEVFSGSSPVVIHAHQPASARAMFSAEIRPHAAGLLRVYSFYAPWAQERSVEKQPRNLSLRGMKEVAASWVIRKMERRLLNKSDLVVALSRYSTLQIEAASRVGHHDVAVIPPGVDARFCPGDRHAARVAIGLPASPPNGSRPLIVTVRRLVKRMGLDDLLRAVAIVTQRGQAVDVVIAGIGPEHNALETLARELSIDDRVRFVGRIAEELLPDLYRAADLFVLPTRALEGFGMATAEALACGTPVLATHIGATPELLARFGAPIAPIEPGEDRLADGISNFLAHREEIDRASRAIATRVGAELTWNACARALVDAYRSALTTPRPSGERG